MMKKYPLFILSIIVLCISQNLQAQEFNEVTKILASDRGNGDYFGSSVSISNNWAVVGVPWDDENTQGQDSIKDAGSVNIFKRNTEDGWDFFEKIISPERDDNTYFGYSVSISGNYLFVGAPYDGSLSQGAAYIFQYNDTSWKFMTKIIAPKAGVSDFFGRSVFISGKYAIVGSERESEDENEENTLEWSGSAYLVEQNDSGNWELVQKIVASDRKAGDFFGYSVALSGNYAIIGSERDYYNEIGEDSLHWSGSAYVFKRNESGTWSQMQKIVASDRARNNNFGQSVSISGNYAIVGSPSSNYITESRTYWAIGSAYIFKLADNYWEEIQRIVPVVKKDYILFGSSVDIIGNAMVVGSPGYSISRLGGNPSNYAGAAYLFENNISMGWEETKKFTASDATNGDIFGNSAAISEEFVIVGACEEDHDQSGTDSLDNAGSAYLFNNCSQNPENNPDNIIENGDFENCILFPWWVYSATWENVSASAIITCGNCIFTPFSISASPQLWQLQLIQDMSASQLAILRKGATYKLSFDAFATENNSDCHVFFGQDENPFTPLLSEMAPVQTSKKTFTYQFVVSEIYSKMKFCFEIGTETAGFTFDNIKLEKVPSGFEEKEVSDQTSSLVYPNPAIDEVFINAPACSEVFLYESAGKLLMQQENGSQVRFSLAGLQKGVYIVRIIGNNNTISEKLIIK